MLRRLLSQPSWAPVRYWLWKRDARRDERAAKSFATSHGKKLVDVYRSPVLDSSVSTTLFILGSGSSINDLTEDMLQHISEHQSVGVNFWFFNDFVPSAFSFDAGRVAEEEEGQRRMTHKLLGEIFSRRVVLDAKPKILHLRPYRGDPDHLFPIPQALESLCWISARANLLSRDVKSVESDLRFLIKRAVRGKLPRAVLPDNGSSVVRLVFLALAQGFTDVCLVGVDLDTRPHFWLSKEYAHRYPEAISLFPTPQNEPHETTHAVNRPISNLQFLATLGKVLRDLGVAQLLLAAPTSKLAPDLPLYPWPENRKRD